MMASSSVGVMISLAAGLALVFCVQLEPASAGVADARARKRVGRRVVESILETVLTILVRLVVVRGESGDDEELEIPGCGRRGPPEATTAVMRGNFR